MEKKGDLLNQLAIITDLIEKTNISSIHSTLVFELKQDEFNQTFRYVNSKHGGGMKVPTNTFTIKMGEVDIVFNKSNV